MVVRELKGDSTQSMHSPWTSSMMTTAGDNNDDSSSSCSETQRHDGYQRKRRGDDDNDGDISEKRRKNREAAKRCREKKQQQTEDLKEKNGELEKENCELAKQRDELIQKCREYQREIEQHREQGCKVPHFNPPYDLSQILNTSSPPSPSFSESAPSTSSCPSPTPSLSPGPSSRHLHARPGLPQNGPSPNMVSAARIQDGMRGIKPSTRPAPAIPAAVTTLTPAQTAQPSAESSQSHFLRVRNKDGSHKVLKLDHENYLKVMQRLRDQRAAKNSANQAQASASMASAYPSQQMPASQLAAQSQQMLVPQVHSHSPVDTSTGMIQVPIVHSQPDGQETVKKTEKNLDTCEDLLSILKSHVKDNGKGFELMPIDPEEVPIKQEPEDTDYQDAKHFLNLDNQSVTGIKREDVNTSDSSGTFISTGQQIRAGLDAITNKDDPSATDAHIQNIVQYLEGGKQTMSGAGPMVSSVCFSAQAARQKEAVHTVAAGQAPRATYVTSSSSMGSLSKVEECAGPASASHHQGTKQHFPNQVTVRLQNGGEVVPGQRLSIPHMQNVTLRLNASNQSVPTSMDCRETLQSVSSASALAAQSTGQMSFGIASAQASQGSVTTSSNVILDQQTRPFASSAPRAMMSIAQTSGGVVTQQQMSRPKMQGLHQNRMPTFQLPTSTTVDTTALGPLQLQTAPPENLMSESTSQITEYLMANSIETLDK